MSRILPILITSSLQIKREKGTLDPIVVQLGKIKIARAAVLAA
jgi:hypothetical protein